MSRDLFTPKQTKIIEPHDQYLQICALCCLWVVHSYPQQTYLKEDSSRIFQKKKKQEIELFLINQDLGKNFQGYPRSSNNNEKTGLHVQSHFT